MMLCAAVATAAAAATPAQWARFEREVQATLDKTAEDGRVAVSFAWKDADREIRLTAGLVNQTDGTRRPVRKDDTFLYGSGSKTFTATAVMKLAERGVLKLTDPVGMHVDRQLMKQGGKTLRELWGPRADKVTVGDVISMQSGIKDYDFDPFFDDRVLFNESTKVVPPYEFIAYPHTQKDPFMCDPETCVEYASTNFVLAGLILTEHSGTDDWTKVVTKAFYPEHTQQQLRDTHFFTDQPLEQWLTVPGLSSNLGYFNNTPKEPPSVIISQNSSITGFTCANVVAPPIDVARFFHMLLHDRTVVSEDSYGWMTDFRMMNAGPLKGFCRYGGGLMMGTIAPSSKSVPTKFDGWGTYMGHGGDVYGFISMQGYFWGLNATISLALNYDQANPSDFYVTCVVIEKAVNILHEVGVDFQCNRTGPLALR